MYLLVSIPSRCLFLWTGSETQISLEHGIFLRAETGAQDSAIFRLENSFGKSQSYFLPLPPPALKTIIHTQKIAKRTLIWVQRYHQQALPFVAWTAVLGILLFATQRGAETAATEPHLPDASETANHAAQAALHSASPGDPAAEHIMRETKGAIGPDQPYASLRANQPGVTQLTLAWPEPGVRDSYAIIPAYGSLSPNLAISIELPFKRIFVYLSSGKWEMKLPSKDCASGQHYQMDVLEKVALAFEADRSQPGTMFSLAQIPPNHAAPESCHSELLEQW